jgi:site-specific recombinase XerD
MPQLPGARFCRGIRSVVHAADTCSRMGQCPRTRMGTPELTFHPMFHSSQEVSAASSREHHRKRAKLPMPSADRAGALPANLARIERLHTELRAYEEHARYVKNHSETTLRVVRGGLKNFVAYLLDHVHLPPEQFETALLDLDGWVGWNRRRGVQPISVNSLWRSLRPFFAYRAKEFGDVNPYAGSRPPRFQQPLPKALDAAACERVLRTARNLPWPSDYERALVLALIETLLYAGLRLGEVRRLDVEHVRLTDRTIRVVKGKGTDGGRDRIAYVNDRLAATLAEYVREKRLRRIEAPEFFVNPRTRRGIGEITIRQYVARIRGASGVNWSPHKLRHSFVTHLLAAGVPIHVVQDLAGHRNISTTLGYTAVFDRDRKVAIEKLRF